ncbi:hypothetical protein N825_28850 [Skermanella stibiiresistens SB22]|uniref:Uncharacterized protein n=1 Tax=Skermanella stibiiresistens SB22 TaxID=1385369 RepID=W9GXS8_9PROT|nr:hypothetical protein N825_28850 [Skermanella stibiiresistens SB22]
MKLFFNTVLLTFLIIGTAAARFAAADPLMPSANGAGLFGEGKSTGAGGSRGNFDHAYPFELPLARGDVGPTLELSYSSAFRNDGDAGYGWFLSLPVIEQRPLSGWPSGKGVRGGGAATLERYAYGGRPLVEVCSGGPSVTLDVPSCSAIGETIPSWASGWRHFRLENEGSFERFFLSSNTRTWRVQVKDGPMLEFGEPLTEPGLASGALELDGPVPVRWRLVREIDQRHSANLAVYTWRRMGKRGLHFLTDVHDTPRIGGVPELETFANHVQLDWEAPPFPIAAYARVDQAMPDLRLSRVGVSSATMDATGQREILRIYRLSYLEARGFPFDPATQAPLFGHSFLASVRMEGNCGHREALGGGIPFGADCAALPPTTFHYEGTVYGSTGFLSEIKGGPQDLAQDRKVLPYLSSAAIIDFDRDGLPDVVQSWENEAECFFKPGAVFLSVEDGPQGLKSGLVCIWPNGQSQFIRSARFMTGLRNIGPNAVIPKFQHVCLDAGDGEPGSLAGLIRPKSGKPPLIASFLGSRGAPTVIGLYGDGSSIWAAGEARFRPIRAEPIRPHPAFCDSPTTSEGWRWQLGSWDIRAWPTAYLGPPFHEQASPPAWYVDIDGDGLADSLSADGPTIDRFYRLSTPSFTRRLGRGEDGRPGGGTGPAQIPFSSPGGTSIVPRHDAPSGVRFFYEDMNADGIVDLVRFGPNGQPRIRPGDGRGGFACADRFDAHPCANGEIIAQAGSGPLPWHSDGGDWDGREERFVHDVTGDGLADIISYRMDPGDTTWSGYVRLWVNVDGRTFHCVDPTNAVPCAVGRLVDHQHGTTTLPSHRTTFADMDANGTDDLVVLTGGGTLTMPFIPTPSPKSRGNGPRPGLLIGIDNGLGAVTKIDYETIPALMRKAEEDGRPWATRVPSIEPVVTRVRTHDQSQANGVGPYAFDRTVEITYRDPAFDPWLGRFMGFRKVSERMGGTAAITERTYWFGPCQKEAIDEACVTGSEGEPDGALVARLVRVDVRQPGVEGRSEERWLSSTEFHYAVDTLFDGLRPVRHAYVAAIQEHHFDPDRPVQRRAARQAGERGGGDTIEPSPIQDKPAPVTTEIQADRHGNVAKVEFRGRQPEGFDRTLNRLPSLDPVSVSWAGSDTGMNLPEAHRCDFEIWRCYIDLSLVTSEKPNDGPYQILRRHRYGYDRQGDLASIDGFLLTGHSSVVRTHPAGLAVAPVPAETSKAPGWIRLLTNEYDPATGSLVRSRLATSGPCTSFVLDAAYGMLPALLRAHEAGCGPVLRESSVTYHRGFGTATHAVSPSGAVSEMRLDHFGRTAEILLPDPDAPFNLVTAATYRYFDGGPANWSRRDRHVGQGAVVTSYQARNGLGEPILSISQDDSGWIFEGWTERDAAGRPEFGRGPYHVTGNPEAILANAGLPPIPAGIASAWIRYDAFGRVETIHRGNDLLGRYTYKPFEVEFRDVLQLAPGGKGRMVWQLDGHGNPKAEIVETTQPSDGIRTWFERAPTGEIVSTLRRPLDGDRPDVVRTFEYDSLGRLVTQTEPNTGTTRYAWDDLGRVVGYTDARRCGANIYRDVLGRVVGVDLSPCEPHHEAYTPPDVSNGMGLEQFYQYDAYEPGQLSNDPSFLDDPAFAIGHLVSVRDRGAFTLTNYDVRGFPRLIRRQVAAPRGLGAAYSYAPRVYATRSDFDLAGRLTRRTLGAAHRDLMVAGQSEERYAWTAQDRVRHVDSSYGPLVRGITWGADGLVEGITYFDAAGTQAQLDRDDKRRLTGYSVTRSSPALWNAPGPGYAKPGPDTTQLEILRLIFGYDPIDNPVMIEDLSVSSWPKGAKPVRRRDVAYDGRYRVSKILSEYATPSKNDTWSSPFGPELQLGDSGPIPLLDPGLRVRRQEFDNDWLGNLTLVDADLQVPFDLWLGRIDYGAGASSPHRMVSGGPARAWHDAAGNMVALGVDREAACLSLANRGCSLWFVYDYDEAGELVRARRWDVLGSLPAELSPSSPPTGDPAWDLSFAYTAGNRVLKSAKGPGGIARHTLEPFDTLRIGPVEFLASGDYDDNPEQVRLRIGTLAALHTGGLGGSAEAFLSRGNLPTPQGSPPFKVFLRIGDRLGSTAAMMDKATGEVVERRTYDAYGAVEADYRPGRWGRFRDDRGFSGAEEDIEIGLVRLGARYLHTRLGRWLTADPLAVHGRAADHNPYSYVDGALFSAIDPSGLQGVPVETAPPPIKEDYVLVRGEPRKKPHSSKDPPDPKVHVNTRNLVKQLWKQIVVDTAKMVIQKPFNPALPHEIADPILDFYTPNIEEEEGDISEWVAFGASLLIPGPGETKLLNMGVRSLEQAAVHFGPRVAENAITRAE